MSRFGGYGDAPGPRGGGERWDPERFAREREIIERYKSGGGSVAERDRFEETDRVERHLSPPTRGGRRRESSADEFYSRRERAPAPPRFEERDRFVVEEKYGPPARRSRGSLGRFFEEEIENEEINPVRGQMVPFEKRRQSIVVERNSGALERRGPPRPTFIRRQSSLDTFDRKPMPRYGDRWREPPEVIAIPAGGHRRRSPPRYVERDFEEIRIAEPDYYGDEEFRGYREREVSTVRTRKRDEEVEIKEREEFEVEEEPEKDAPRRGKTRMPMRLINKRVIIELGYPFEEEGETLVILKALGKHHIDEVISRSREMNEKIETRTTYVIEAPPPPPEIVERRTEIVLTPPEDAPRSVREWDMMKSEIREVSPSGKSHKTSKSEKRQPSPSVKSHKTSRTERREPSPSAKSHKTSKSSRHSRRRSVSSDDTIRESFRREVVIEKDGGEESSSLHGPLTLIEPSRHKDEQSIKAEIRALEAESRALKLERDIEKEHRRAHRHRDTEYIIEKDREVKIEKDRKAPNPKLLRAMLGTLT